MKISELQSILEFSLPIFRKYAADPSITFASGRYPLNLQDYLFTAMSMEDRDALKAAGWQTNGAAAWFYEPPAVNVVEPTNAAKFESTEEIATRLRSGAIFPPLLKSL